YFLLLPHDYFEGSPQNWLDFLQQPNVASSICPKWLYQLYRRRRTARVRGRPFSIPRSDWCGIVGGLPGSIGRTKLRLSRFLQARRRWENAQNPTRDLSDWRRRQRCG